MRLRLSLACSLALAVVHAAPNVRTFGWSPANATTYGVPEAPNCGREIANLAAVQDVPMILLGELHGQTQVFCALFEQVL